LLNNLRTTMMLLP